MSALNDFSMLPLNDPQSTPDEDLNAAVAGALGLPDAITPAVEAPELPLGRTWAFDWQAGQFTRAGQSPVERVGLDAVAEWCMMTVHAARYAHVAFSDDFGMERPDSLIGEFAVGEALADWTRHLTEALMVHDRVASIENVSLRWDATAGALRIDQLDVVTDEDQRFTVSDVTLHLGGATS